MDLVTFLAARLDEDEAAAKKNQSWMRFEPKRPGDWTRLMCDPVMGPFGGQSATRNVGTGLYVGKMSDPARVLCEVGAGRKILALHHSELIEGKNADGDDRSDFFCAECDYEKFPCPTLRLLAAVYSGHPDYREEWKP